MFLSMVITDLAQFSLDGNMFHKMRDIGKRIPVIIKRNM